MPSVEVNGITLHYEDTGQGDDGKRPAVAWLHGAAGNHISWWQQIPVFREHYRCIAIDHRGFGRSIDHTGEGVTRFVDDFEALLDHLGIERIALVAQSMGGRTALGFAVRHPDRVSALVMADTWGFFNWPELREEVRQQREADPERDRPLSERAIAESFKQGHPELAFLYRQISALNPPRAEQPEDSAAPTRDEVAALDVRVLFLVGSEDVLTPPAVIHRVHELVAGSHYVEMEGSGHSVYFEDPVGFNDVVGSFLAQHTVRGDAGGGGGA